MYCIVLHLFCIGDVTELSSSADVHVQLHRLHLLWFVYNFIWVKAAAYCSPWL